MVRHSFACASLRALQYTLGKAWMTCRAAANKALGGTSVGNANAGRRSLLAPRCASVNFHLSGMFDMHAGCHYSDLHSHLTLA